VFQSTSIYSGWDYVGVIRTVGGRYKAFRRVKCRMRKARNFAKQWTNLKAMYSVLHSIIDV